MISTYKVAKDNYRKKIGELTMKIKYEFNPIKGIVAIGIDTWKNELEPFSQAVIKEALKVKQIDSFTNVNLKYLGLNGYDWEYDILKQQLTNTLTTIDYWNISNINWNQPIYSTYSLDL
jgi:phosphotransferase system IIA component